MKTKKISVFSKRKYKFTEIYRGRVSVNLHQSCGGPTSANLKMKKEKDYLAENQRFSFNAFTLIELLVVIAIIALLASIVLVSLKGARERAQTAKTMQWARSVFTQLGGDAVLVYNFNDCQATDLSSYGNNGILQGGVSCVDGIPGFTGKALRFDGNNDYVSVPISTSLQPRSELTLEAWIRPDPSYIGDIIILGQGAYYLTYTTNGSIRCYWYGKNPAGYHSSGDGVVAAGNWHHILAVWDTSKVRIYVNAVEKFSTAYTGVGNSAVNQVWFGAEWNGSVRQFNGTIDEVRIYSRALTAMEIQEHYTEGLEKHQLAEK